MAGKIGLQTVNDYKSNVIKSRRFSTSPVTAGVKQKKAAPGIRDNRQLLSEQLSLLETIRGERVERPVAGGVIQGRIPNFAELNALHNQLSVDVIKEKVKILLTNLQLDKLILQGEGETVNVDLLIEADGSVNKTYYEQLFGKANGTEDKEKVYHQADRSHSALNPTDEANLKTMLLSAQAIVTQTIPFEKKLQQVFGDTESKDAKNNYTQINKKLNHLEKNLTKKVTTDYNGDDTQLGIGGYANFGRQDMHIMQNLCENVNSNGITTAIHECAHLANSSIKDYGYMGTSGFEFMTGDRKINNAAHYEVIPSWILGKTIPYPVGHQFTPHNLVGGGGVSNLVLGKKDANDFFESAWSVAVNLSLKLKNLYSKGEPVKLTDDLMNISRKLSLTIHQSTNHRVSLLDVTLMQDITRTLSFMMRTLSKDKEKEIPRIGREYYKFHFINKMIATNQKEGVTSDSITYLYRLASK